MKFKITSGKLYFGIDGKQHGPFDIVSSCRALDQARCAYDARREPVEGELKQSQGALS